MRLSKQRVEAWEREIEALLRSWPEEVDWDEVEEALEEEDERRLKSVLYGALPLLVLAYVARSYQRPVSSEIAVESLSVGRRLPPSELRERAARIVASSGLSLVRYLADTSWEEVRARIAQWIREGLTPTEIGNRLKDLLPLTPRQAASLEKARELWKAMGLPEEEVARRVAELRDRYLSSRAQSIAHTEFRRAWNEAKLETWRELAEEGYLPKEKAIKVWRTLPGCCPDCAELEGATAPFDEPFPGTELDSPPLHPNCRCYLEHL